MSIMHPIPKSLSSLAVFQSVIESKNSGRGTSVFGSFPTFLMGLRSFPTVTRALFYYRFGTGRL